MKVKLFFIVAIVALNAYMANAATNECLTDPVVECEECLTDCCEELLIAIKTYEDCSCPLLTEANPEEDRQNFYLRVFYRELSVWLKWYCYLHGAHLTFGDGLPIAPYYEYEDKK
ncbi:uncharacterized protein [Haliotis cracherodii]|uniref:uncharacterized protein n=1 Tax=Haliotis cracherodii TaxID=6455 RepID=UPI0039E85A6C